MLRYSSLFTLTMRLQLLALPASILLLLASNASAQALKPEQDPAQWRADSAWPEAASIRRRAVEEHLRLGRKPVGVVKMSDDPGEKFYLEYWHFEGDSEQKQMPMGGRDGSSSSGLGRRDVDREEEEEEQKRLAANSSAVLHFRPPFVLHTDDSSQVGSAELRLRDSKRALAALQKRGFTCPTGTSSCANIGFPGSCCTTNEACFEIEDTGLGPVGCCPAGATCGGTIDFCDAPNTACSSALGGGCCILNYLCVKGGCEFLLAALIIREED